MKGTETKKCEGERKKMRKGIEGKRQCNRKQQKIGRRKQCKRVRCSKEELEEKSILIMMRNIFKLLFQSRRIANFQ